MPRYTVQVIHNITMVATSAEEAEDLACTIPMTHWEQGDVDAYCIYDCEHCDDSDPNCRHCQTNPDDDIEFIPFEDIVVGFAVANTPDAWEDNQ